MKKIEQTLILLSNLAIPPNEKSDKGLGDLIESNISTEISELIKNFIDKNHKFLNKICDYLIKDELQYKNFIDNLYQKENSNDVRYFLEEFRVFAIKIYFSHPYTIKKLNLFEKFIYDNIEIRKDNLILNSLYNKNNNVEK